MESEGGGPVHDLLSPSSVSEIPGGKLLDNAISSLNKKASGALMGALKRTLSTASDPLFRQDLGERHFTRNSAEASFLLWLGGTLASCWTGTLIIHIFQWLNWRGEVVDVFRNKWLPLIAGLMFMSAYAIWCRSNFKRIEKFREEQLIYHTRSRGRPRWPAERAMVPWMIILGLVLFAPVLGILVVAATLLSLKLAEEQQQAIRSAYLDALDKEIEDELIEPALLGDVDVAQTYLSRPLPASMNPALKANTAAAAVGKPVKIVAKGPKRTKPSGNVPPPPSASRPVRPNVRRPAPEPAEAAKQYQKEEPPSTQASDDDIEERQNETVESKQQQSTADRKRQKFYPDISKIVRNPMIARRKRLQALAVLGVVAILIAAVYVSKKNTSDQGEAEKTVPQKTQPISAGKSLPPPSAASVIPAFPETNSSPPVKIGSAAPPPQTAATTSVVKIEAVPENAGEALAKPVAPVYDERSMWRLLSTNVQAQYASFMKFGSDCDNRIIQASNQIAGIAWSQRSPLRKELSKFSGKLHTTLSYQLDRLNEIEITAHENAREPASDLKKVSKNAEETFASVNAIKQNLEAELQALETRISGAPAKKVF